MKSKEVKITQRLNSPNVKIIDYKDYNGGFVYDEVSKKYFSNINGLKRYYDNILINVPYPHYVYSTYFEPYKLDLINILEDTYGNYLDTMLEKQSLENINENTYLENLLNGVKELRKAINKFNESNKEIGDYCVDYNTIIKLNWRNKYGEIKD
ncbi:MAG: hypothetical protein ACLR02_09865 [Clostridium sp.]